METRSDATPNFRASQPYLKLRALTRLLLNYANAAQGFRPRRVAADRRDVPPELQIRVDGLTDIRYPEVDLDAVLNPLPAILESPELAETSAFFCRSPSATRSLVSAVAQALIYALVRNIRPDHVFEIGTYMAGTAEAICRGLHANARGILHTTDPFGGQRVPPVLACWPHELREHIRFYCCDSMAFFSQMVAAPEIRPALVFIDGNHDFEYAAFDIGCAARLLRPSGFIVVDNVSQAGPYWAARDFLALYKDWTECPITERGDDPSKAFDVQRSKIPDTDLIVLRAPAKRSIGERPVTFGELPLGTTGFEGIMVPISEGTGDGTLHVQCILRGFAEGRAVEEVGSTSCAVSSRDAGRVLSLPVAMDLGVGFDVIRLEVWLIWSGARPLLSDGPPVPWRGDAVVNSQGSRAEH